MPDHASPAFLLWHAGSRGDWDRVLSRPATADVRVALRALQDLPTAAVMLEYYRERLMQSMLDLESGFLERFGVQGLWDGT